MISLPLSKAALVALAVLALSPSPLLLAQAATPPETADDLIARNIAAHGGLANLKSITSLRWSGKLEVSGIVILLSADQKPPQLSRQSVSIQGMTQVQAYDGSAAWQINPFQGRRDPELMGDDDTRDFVENADFYGPLVDYKEKGSKVDYLGHETVDGDDALALKITLKNGDIIKYLIDPETFLEIRTEKQMFIRGKVKESYSNVGSYKKVNGVFFPFSIESGAPHDPANAAKITYNKMEANLDIPDSEFKMPPTATPAAKPPANQPTPSASAPQPAPAAPATPRF